MFTKYPKNIYFIGLFLLMAVGVFLRLYKLGILPVGLNADEASIGFEALSLLKKGTDRWGIKIPPYFLSFGSGQNTMYAYLSVPFIYLFDLSQASIRYLSAFLGLATLPLVYWFAGHFSKNIYFIWACVIFYLLDPYHFMISRWALEYNILPFFVILTLYLFSVSFEKIQDGNNLRLIDKFAIFASFPSLALIIYTYASALFIVPVFVCVVLVFFKNELLKHKTVFLLSIGLMVFLLLPFILFILKNNILKTELAIEQYLPFEIPKMLSNREEVFKGLGANLAIIKKNIFFIFSGFKETNRFINTTSFFNPHFLLVFSLVGLIYSLFNFFNTKKIASGIISFWALACFVPFLFFEMNLNRSVHLQAVIPVLAIIGLFMVIENIADSLFKKTFIAGILMVLTIQYVLFFGEYFLRFPNYDQFITGFGQALTKTNALKKKGEKVAITYNLVFNYLYVCFYEKYSPEQFQKTLKADFTHPNVAVESFEGYEMLGDVANMGYYFNIGAFESLKKENSFLAILKPNEQIGDYKDGQKSIIDSTKYTSSLIYNSAEWKAIRFTKKAAL